MPKLGHSEKSKFPPSPQQSDKWFIFVIAKWQFFRLPRPPFAASFCPALQYNYNANFGQCCRPLNMVQVGFYVTHQCFCWFSGFTSILCGHPKLLQGWEELVHQSKSCWISCSRRKELFRRKVISTDNIIYCIIFSYLNWELIINLFLISFKSLHGLLIYWRLW